MQTKSPTTSTPSSTLGAGFRYSTYGPSYNPGPDYWISVGERMAAKFPGATPQAIWIVGELNGNGTLLSFSAETNNGYISSSTTDMNEETLDQFDKHGFKVWLQVEPGNADVIELIHLVMNQYGHHSCVIGFGVDVEWYKSSGPAEGTPVTDEEAAAWVEAVRSHNPDYLLFLKHWDYNWMPPTARDGIVFVDDSQQFTSLDQMVEEFAGWGEHFAPALVAFQYGYSDDRIWWGKLQDPPGEIGQAILEVTPNTSALFWVDFTVLDIFPPQP